MKDRIESLLRDAIGLDPQSIGQSVVDGAIRQRCAACGCADEMSYWPLLAASPVERQALVEAVVVPETWFYRYPDSFAVLQRLARARLDTTGGAKPLRLLSLPCSTGEEPYSIVIALLEAGIPPEAFGVEAIDVSTHALEAAGRGEYGRNAFRDDLPPLLVQRYFDRQEDVGKSGHWRIADKVRDRVRFRRGNLLDPMLLANEPPADFLFCRNLMIYFDRPTQARAVRALRRRLHPDGVLFAGPAEASVLSQCGMTALGVPHSFGFCHPGPESAGPESAGPESAGPGSAGPGSAGPGPAAAPTPAPARPGAGASAPRPAVTGGQPAQPAFASAGAGAAAAADLAEGLKAIAALADGGRVDEAQALCEQCLSRHGPAADLYYWLGLLHDARQDARSAERFYRKALYLEPDHAAARAHMAAQRAARAAADAGPQAGPQAGPGRGTGRGAR